MENKLTFGRVMALLLSAVFTLAFIAMFVRMMPVLGVTVGTAAPEQGHQRAALEFSDAYQRHITNLSAAAMEGIIPIPKSYVLPEDTVIAPVPDPANFGESFDPNDTLGAIERAEELLDGQTLLFSPERTLHPNCPVRWYQDDTILSITWKEVINWVSYTFTEVKVADPSQFRRYFADNTFASPVQYLPTELAQTVHAVSAMSADFYKFRQYGIVIYQRQLYRTEGRWLDSCFVDGKGDLNFIHRGDLTTEEEIQRYIDENDIRFSLSFGPILIEDGVNVVPENYLIGELKDNYARAAICQLDELHYLLVTANHERYYADSVPTMATVARVLYDMGVPKAYTLDGGQTASMIYNGTLINSVEFGYQRAVSDIIYFATAIPEKQQWEAEHG